MKKRSAMGLVALATFTVLAGATVSPAQADDPGVAADCSVLGQVAGNAVGRLTPIQSLPDDQKQAARDGYISELQGTLSSVNSSRGQADLQAYISALQNASSPADAQGVLTAIIALQNDCP
ncbi:MAG: hypothetical protein JWN03_3199 [Nocardia sp.]|uniref:hypothetical protein n=1 Tax=Nocardia sp. TaxID=1821 RepID=UPI00261F3D5F|nr:hypothetical protein [Nocardia sp.]MCU1642924.1 hypothetical protein [Nocardia sp.]